ncbi:MAG: hypothetical protein MJ118_00085 [Clostridia bacterium]|nr:hypothetical protein [Clostridia bacterium]
MDSQKLTEERQQALLAVFSAFHIAGEHAMLAALSALDGHDGELCRKALEICRPTMALLQQEPEPGWLEAICEHLSANLFPDETHPASALSEAERFFLCILETLFAYYEGSADPLTDFLRFDDKGIAQSRVAQEYDIFKTAVVNSHYLALMRITRELRPIDPASHIIGVHNVALHTAVFAAKAGLKVDLPLVSAASAGHDIGKFGCRGEDAARVPYFHYYYTWQWFSENGMENIGHIAANHSTWDLEFENLPIESLLLIYADFRVRGTWENGKEQIRIYSLADSYDMIFSKLANMTPERRQRYQTVYSKLRDFEQLLISRGVPTEITVNTLSDIQPKDASLLQAGDALQALRSMTLAGSMRLMRTVSTDLSFSRLLEQAKSEKNLHRIRTYLTLFMEYSTYMSKANKKKLLVLLYELLTHPDGDVRRMAGSIMGTILANSGPKYRKERPTGAHENAMTPAMMALLDESVELWANYIQLCLHPDRKNSPKHALRIANSLKTICQSLFASCDEKDAARLIAPLLQAFEDESSDRFVLADAFCHVPCRYLPEDSYDALLGILKSMLESGLIRYQLVALRCLHHLQDIPALSEPIRAVTANTASADESTPAFSYLQHLILGTTPSALSEKETSALYLSNLKNAVHWTVKLAPISLLCRDAMAYSRELFHTALQV